MGASARDDYLPGAQSKREGDDRLRAAERKGFERAIDFVARRADLHQLLDPRSAKQVLVDLCDELRAVLASEEQPAAEQEKGNG